MRSVETFDERSIISLSASTIITSYRHTVEYVWCLDAMPQLIDDIRDASLWENLREKPQLAKEWFLGLSRTKQILIISGIVLSPVGALLYPRFIMLLMSSSEWWRNLGFPGVVLLFSLIFLVSFPPLIGYGALSLLTGMIYGCPGGWPLLASASVIGSTCSFLVFRRYFSHFGRRIIERHDQLKIFSLVVNGDNEKNWKESLLVLSLLRLCPTPYSLSNGAIACVPNLSLKVYIASYVITSPHLLIALYMGSTLAQLGDETTTKGQKVVSVIGAVIATAAFSAATFVIYFKMQKKLQERDGGLQLGDYDDDDLARFDIESGDYDEDNIIL